MKYRNFGNTDIKLSLISLGTMTFGEQNTQEEGFGQMDYALEQGINFFDTAEMYPVPTREATFGETERIVGNWFASRKKRKSVFLATKITGYRPGMEYIRGGSEFTPKQLREALEASLKRLQTDYVDLYQLHWPMRKTNVFGKLGYQQDEKDEEKNNFKEVLETLQEFITEGKVRYVGLSNETPWGTMSYLKLSEMYGLPRMQSVQNPYSLLNRSYEAGMSEVSLRERVGLLAYSPMAGGYLSGKYFRGPEEPRARFNLFKGFNRYGALQSEAAAREYVALADKFNVSPGTLALAYVNSRDFVTSNIIGATSLAQLKEDIASVDFVLPEALEEAIEEIHTRYPYPAP